MRRQIFEETHERIAHGPGSVRKAISTVKHGVFFRYARYRRSDPLEPSVGVYIDVDAGIDVVGGDVLYVSDD